MTRNNGTPEKDAAVRTALSAAIMVLEDDPNFNVGKG